MFGSQMKGGNLHENENSAFSTSNLALLLCDSSCSDSNGCLSGSGVFWSPVGATGTLSDGDQQGTFEHSYSVGSWFWLRAAAFWRPLACPVGLGYISLTRLVSSACWRLPGILPVPDRSSAEMSSWENAAPLCRSAAVYQNLELSQQHYLLHNVTPHLNDQLSWKDQVQGQIRDPKQGRFFFLLFPVMLFVAMLCLQFRLSPSGGTLLH